MMSLLTCFNKLGFVWAEEWNNGAMGCSLKVVTSCLMDLDGINDHSEVSHGRLI